MPLHSAWQERNARVDFISLFFSMIVSGLVVNMQRSWHALWRHKETSSTVETKQIDEQNLSAEIHLALN